MALAEALARGLPIVSTNAGAIPGTVPPSAGMLVEPGDPAAFAGAVRQVMTEPSLRDLLAAGATSERERLPGWQTPPRRLRRSWLGLRRERVCAGLARAARAV